MGKAPNEERSGLHMIQTKGGKKMPVKIFKAIIRMIRIIIIKSETKEEMLKALDEIQSQLETQ